MMLIPLLFAQSKALGHLRDKRKKLSIVLLVYYTLIDNYMYKHVQDQRHHRYGIQQTIEQVQLGELDVVELCIDERQGMSEELLGIVSVPVDDTLSMSGVTPHDGGCGELHSGMDSSQGPSPFSH